VKVISGNLTGPTDREIKEFGADIINEGYWLACQADVIDGEVVIDVAR
jgi:ferredoxin